MKSKIKRLNRAAGKLNRALQDVAFTKWTPRKQKKFDKRKLGKLGAASEVRIIKPETDPDT